MGAARESRKSELIFRRVWGEMQHLCNCVWYPSLENAEEHVDSIKNNLDLTIQEMKVEDSQKRSLTKEEQAG